MLFHSVTALLVIFLFTRNSLAALTPDAVVTNIGTVTIVSGKLNSVLGGLTTSTPPSVVPGVSQTIVTGFNIIINDLTGDMTAMQATPPFTDDVAQPIVDALKEFVLVHQALLSTVIGKHSIFAQFGVTAPIAAVLRSLEAIIDSFAFGMIDLIPSRRSDITNDKNSLDSSVGNTITLYLKLCFPSPLYPIVLPLCIAV